ncbi:MAG: ABC transporter ATP-binding protein [Bacteroidales bacterium]|nr:ABC transporter ATP-binding protein [Candidatus Cacconaster merdequi]
MKDFKSSIKGVLIFARPVWKRNVVSIAIGFVRIAASLLFVWVSKCLVDIATGTLDKPLNLYVALMAGIVALQIIGSLAASYWESYNIVQTKNALRYNIFSHVLKSAWNGRETYHSADVLNRIQEDIRVMVDLVCTRIPDIVITVCQLIGASIFLVSMAPNLLGLLVVLMIVAVLGSKLFYKTMRRLTEKIRELDSRSQQHIQENLQNRVLVITLIGVERVLEKFKSIQDDIRRLTISRMNYNAVARAFMGVGFMAGYTAAFLWGIYGIRDGVVTYGMMTAFLQLVGQVQRPIANLGGHVPAIIQALTSEERLADLVSLSASPIPEGELLDSAPDLVFDGITFSYSQEAPPVLNNFSHTFPAGALTVVMGPTGRGKSTLARIAMGLLKPQSGKLSVPGICNYMYVPQGNTLMSGTIRENLLLACSDVTEERMREVLHTAAADFVFDLPDGLDTRCGETGTGLSEGQAQRISIARALLHSGTILILDEATSALDGVTEDIFLSNLVREYHGRKTIIFISHRERVISYADEVLTM